MKVIFLDIDGVLNTDPDVKVTGQDLNPKLVKRLGNLTRTTAAGIVITSSWRHRFDIDEIKRMFKDNDFGGEVPIIGTTDLKEPEESRGEHIKKFMKDHDELKISNYVILDDRHKETLSKKQLKRYVQPDPLRGMSLANFEKAKSILLNPKLQLVE